jgi:signal transduction histidine kinase/CheY-like chemotaxis protein
MKLTYVIGAAALLLLLISMLSLLGMNPEASRYDRALAAISSFVTAEGALRRDILSARAGLLRNYDPLNQAKAALHRSVADLRRAEVDNAVLGPLDALIREQDGLAERFKTDNALLQNSLAYFGLLSGRLGKAIPDAELDSAMTDLATSMLHLTLDTSAASVEAVGGGLGRLAGQPIPIGYKELVDGLLAHGRLLQRLLPETDRTVRALYNLPRYRLQEAVRASVVARQEASRARARRFRLLLYATTLVLLLLLINLGLQLKHRMLALRRRVLLEHAIATLSMAFIDAESDESRHRIEQALAELAYWGGADRAYLIASAAPPRVYLWSRDDGNWPSDWPGGARTLATRMGAEAEGLIHVPSVSNLPNGSDREALARAGLDGWICIVAKGLVENGVFLGFDSLRRPMTWPAGELGLLRMAVDAVGNAAGRARLEREQARLEASLQQARRMETVGALTSGIAHNFANIIGAILGHTEMQEAEVAAGSRLAHHVDGVRHAALRARDLIDQIMTYGRRRELPTRQVCLRSLMAETKLLLSASLPDGARLDVGVIPETALVYGDLVQLQQVIINLCNNAVQAMDGRGAVELAIDLEMVAEPLVLSHGHVSVGRYARITVKDSGRGMDTATLEHLFEPFFTTRTNGNGLGLATVREIVSAHGGGINVTSLVGEGSSFEIWLPHVAGAEASTAQFRLMPVRGEGETILLIGDDRAGLLHDEEIVAAIGYEPVGFVELEQALTACQRMPQRFDAVLISHRMPSLAALAFIRKIHTVAPALPITLAAVMNEVDANVLAHSGVSELVARPLISIELAAALSRCLPR